MLNKQSTKAGLTFAGSLKNWHYLACWCIFHVVVLLFFGVTLWKNPGNLNIDADVMNMMPLSFDDAAIGAVSESVVSSVSRNVYVLVGNQDFTAAVRDAETVYDKLSSSSNFTSLTLQLSASEEKRQEAFDVLSAYRWNLLPEETADAILSGGAEVFAQNALSKAYGGFTLSSLDSLDTDPFLLNDTILTQYYDMYRNTGTLLTLKDDYIAAQYQDNWYVLLLCRVNDESLAITGDDNAVAELYSVCTPIEQSGSGTHFVYHGVPVNSYHSSQNAFSEVRYITIVSILAVVIILFSVFKNPIPLLWSLLSIGISVITAFAGTMAVFHKIHVLTLVFGTSLIGSCIDYSLHFFVNWKANTDLTTGSEIRQHLLKGLFLSLVSTILCYTVMMFCPYNMIKQMALFSVLGLLSSFLTTISLYPYSKVPADKRYIHSVRIMEKPDWWNKKKIGRWVVTFMFVIPTVIILFLFDNGTILNRLNKLYNLEGRVAEDSQLYREIAHFDPSGWFIISGESIEDVLQRDEKLRSELSTYRTADGNKLGYVSVSSFIPSIAAQMKSREACRLLLEQAEEQYEMLGFDLESADTLRADFASSEGSYVTIDSLLADSRLESVTDTVWLGTMNGKYYSILLPVESNDAAAFRKAAEIDDRINYANKIEDVSENLDELTKLIIGIMVVAFILLYVLLRLFYRRKQAAKIISIPFLILIMVYAVCCVTNVHLEFFSIIGIVLVLGLGLDYIIYMMENENKSQALDETQLLEPYGILLSFITTAISFGALSLSSFGPLHYMGLSIFIGLATAYVASFFYDRS